MDQEIFKGKSFSNLLEDIYNNSKKKEKQITTLIKDLHKSRYLKNIFDQNQAKIPSYSVFSTIFKKWKHHVDVLGLLKPKKKK